jgi:hypothetical protein
VRLLPARARPAVAAPPHARHRRSHAAPPPDCPPAPTQPPRQHRSALLYEPAIERARARPSMCVCAYMCASVCVCVCVRMCAWVDGCSSAYLGGREDDAEKVQLLSLRRAHQVGHSVLAHELGHHLQPTASVHQHGRGGNVREREAHTCTLKGARTWHGQGSEGGTRTSNA